jgi:hypothetical protein
LLEKGIEGLMILQNGLREATLKFRSVSIIDRYLSGFEYLLTAIPPELATLTELFCALLLNFLNIEATLKTPQRVRTITMQVELAPKGFLALPTPRFD